MIFSPAILALLTGSLLTTLLLVYGTQAGLRIAWRWDLRVATEEQLSRERKTYLVSSLLSHVIVLKLLLLVLFIAVADSLHDFFSGAMCAAGTLNANSFGYPALLLMVITFLLCSVWLIFNRLDQKADDFPLLRLKYGFLAVLAPVSIVESAFLTSYFVNLDPQVITSCCGTLFGEGAGGLAAELAHVPTRIAQPVFWSSIVFVLGAGVFAYLTGRGSRVFSVLSAAALPISLAAVISFISLYYYQMPTHHCPFCLLQGDYGHIGYLIYATLFMASVTGMGPGLIEMLGRTRPSLETTIPRLSRRLCLASLAGFSLFAATAVWPIVFYDFALNGY